MLKYSITALVGLVSFATGIFATSAIHAAPVTFRFEAVVGPPRVGFQDDLGLPFTFVQGAMIKGNFTFEPLDVTPDIQQTSTIQVHSASIIIDSFKLTSSSYNINVLDNSLSDDVPIPTDEIRLGCNLANCSPQEISGIGTPTWSFGITLIGNSDILVGADIPDDVADWNRFLDEPAPPVFPFGEPIGAKSLLVSFNDVPNSRFSGFQATIVSFQVIPEPGSFVQILLIINSAMVIRSRL